MLCNYLDVASITMPTNIPIKTTGIKLVIIEIPKVDNFVRIKTTQDMFDQVGKYFDNADVLIKAAAPADYKPKYYSKEKIKKNSSYDLNNIELEKNPDIAKYYGSKKSKQIIVGFAAESTNIYEYAKDKLNSKNLDMIVVNNIVREGAGFSADTNIASIIDKNLKIEDFNIMTKIELADKILNRISKLFS